MKKFFKRLLLVLLLAFIVLQFFRPAKNSSKGPFPNDIATIFPVPADVQQILKTSCNDCHSNNTEYPWYNNIQPVAWWVNSHVVDGKKDLNFNEFATYSLRRQYKKLDEINELVKENKMPINSYLWMHKNAKLDEKQKLVIANWCEALRDSMKARYPIDSLVRKKQ